MLYRVNYNYVSPKNQLRSSALIIDAKSEAEATTEATKQLATSNQKHIRITGVNKY